MHCSHKVRLGFGKMRLFSIHATIMCVHHCVVLPKCVVRIIISMVDSKYPTMHCKNIKMNDGWISFRYFSFRFLVLCMLAHCHTVTTYWETWTEQSLRNVISKTCVFPTVNSQNVVNAVKKSISAVTNWVLTSIIYYEDGKKNLYVQ